jgi:hypothetical protein
MAKLWFSITAVSALLATLLTAAEDLWGSPPELVTSLVNADQTLCLYTNHTNAIVAVTSFMLARRPERRSPTFAGLTLAALSGIAITGIVYNTLLLEHELDPLAALASGLAHTVTPVIAVIGWLLFGPIGAQSWRLIPYALLSPIAWAVMMLTSGAMLGVYPYFFVDVVRLGYLHATANLFGLGVLFVTIAAIFVWVDILRARRRRGG